MDNNIKWFNEQKILRTIEALKKNKMNGYLVNDNKELISKIEELTAEGSKVACGGSMTLFETGVIEHLRSGRYDFLDRYNISLENFLFNPYVALVIGNDNEPFGYDYL